MTSVRQHHHQPPALTGTVVLTCELRQEYPDSILAGIDGATAPAPPRDPNAGTLPPAALDGMHVVLDIGDAPGFLPGWGAGWEASLTARLVHRAASVEVRGTNPLGVARVRSDLAHALAHQDDDGVPVVVMP
ncbi:hypothetical protein PWG71_28510 [Nocardiopsis sp. N85]|uniref:hypothetical protein n=1 Tax=Nocardiopsis sp. N85 TaxID=3029400 RepID=UPI00237F095B|nr:hypothetical protein [Nocardiopsis sp. N85]MDE3725340.1 hypothetical protein [Nocardiopsis sp. N85]